MKPFQPDLPFFGDESGYSEWRNERDRAIKKLEEKFGVLLMVPVRLQLRDFAHPFLGSIEFVPGTDQNPRFRLRGERFDFGLDEIESCERT